MPFLPSITILSISSKKLVMTGVPSEIDSNAVYGNPSYLAVGSKSPPHGLALRRPCSGSPLARG